MKQDLVVSSTRNWQWKKEGGWSVESRLWLYRQKA